MSLHGSGCIIYRKYIAQRKDMNSINDFPWNRTELIEKQYDEPNYRIVNGRSDKKKALVFFSSNGIYYPNTEKEFTGKIITLDYYDWLNIGKHRLIRSYFSRIVYVRDIYKQWYVTGINRKINTRSKLCDFLRDELKGYDITTCGSSSGGYMAALVGSLLNAERIIDSSGQFDLSTNLGNEPFLDLMADDPVIKEQLSLKDIISGHTGSLYYFYPAHNQGDIVQNEHISDLDVKRFAMDSDRHNRTIRPVCFPYVLTMPKDRLDGLQEKYNGRIIGEAEFYKDTLSVLNRITDPVLYNISRVYSYARKRICGR